MSFKDEQLMKTWWKSHINTWVDSDSEAPAEKSRKVEVNIDQGMRGILWKWVKLIVWEGKRQKKDSVREIKSEKGKSHGV